MTHCAKRFTGAFALWLGMLACTLPATAGIDDFKLTRVIPADAALAVHSRDHDGMAFLNKQYARVWKVAEEQDFEKVLRTFLKGQYQASGGDLEQFERNWQQFNDLLLGVEWKSLCDQEMAFAMKLAFPTPEFVVLCTSTPEKAASNFEGLGGILAALKDFAGEGALTLSTQGEGDSLVHTLAFANAPVPLGLMLAREKGTLLIGFGQTMPEQTLALLRGQTGQALASTERFKAAFKQLPAPTDGLMFVDVARFLGQVRAWAEGAMGMADPTGEELEPEIKALPAKIIAALDICEYVAAVETTDGLKTVGDSIAVLRPDAQSKPLYKVLCTNGTLEDPLKFIPADAQNFSVWSGINLGALYDGIITFIRDNVPGGADVLLQWDAAKADMKENLDLDFEKDILGWIGGGLGSFSIAGKSAYSPPSWAFMISVKDEAKAREMLDRLALEITPKLEEQNGAVRDANIEGAEGFKVIVHPMLVMVPGLAQPTVGVSGGQLFLGSDPKAVTAALTTAAGKTPNFSTNERFQKEGLPLQSNVMALQFTDLTKLGENLGQLFKMAQMLPMFIPGLGQDPSGRALLVAAGKVGNVVAELNFFQSSCSQTTFDGKVMYTKTVTNYREPPKPEIEAPTEEKKESPPDDDIGG